MINFISVNCVDVDGLKVARQFAKETNGVCEAAWIKGAGWCIKISYKSVDDAFLAKYNDTEAAEKFGSPMFNFAGTVYYPGDLTFK